MTRRIRKKKQRSEMLRLIEQAKREGGAVVLLEKHVIVLNHMYGYETMQEVEPLITAEHLGSTLLQAQWGITIHGGPCCTVCEV